MKRWIRARLFSVLWDLGDWTMRSALRLDPSVKQVHWVHVTYPPTCTSTTVTFS